MAYPANMPQKRGKLTLLARVYSVVRSLVAPVSAGGDPVALTDASYDPAEALSAQGFETILVGVEVVNGTGQETVVVEPLFYDVGATDGSRWRRRLVGAPEGTPPLGACVPQQTPPLGAGQDYEPSTWTAGRSSSFASSRSPDSNPRRQSTSWRNRVAPRWRWACPLGDPYGLPLQRLRRGGPVAPRLRDEALDEPDEGLAGVNRASADAPVALHRRAPDA